MKPWLENDKLFYSELKEGFFWQMVIAESLRERGFDIFIPRLQMRETVEDRHKYANSKDIIANGLLFETKSRREKLSKDKRKQRPLFVDTVSSWRKKHPKPFGYILISRIDRVMIWTPSQSDKDWTIIEAYDRMRNLRDRWYAYDPNLFKEEESLVTLLQSRKQNDGIVV